MQTAKKLLFDRYIKPTIGNNNNFIGVEIEMPIVNLNKEAVEFEIIHDIADRFIKHFKFEAVGIDENGDVYSAVNRKNGDIMSFDCSYNNLELSFGKAENLFEIKERFYEYYSCFQSLLQPINYTLTGMGVNPYRDYNRNVPIPNGRYRMLFHHLASHNRYGDMLIKFHSFPAFGTFSSASQVQLDVNYDELTDVINLFSKLEPIKAVLFSNSVMYENESVLCWRDAFWEHSTHGINSHNIGMFDTDLNSVDELLNYIATTSIYCVERGKKYINFEPIIFADYLNKTEVEGEYFDNGEYKKITFKPVPSDIEYLRTFKFEDLTFRGTIEFRSVCCQPISDSMTVAAFHLGIKNNLAAARRIIDNDTVLFGNGYSATELRKLMIKAELPSFVDEDRLYELARQIVDTAYDGLKLRGLGEEALLAPLYDRIKTRQNPAQKMLSLKNSGMSMEEIVKMYSEQ